jgi:HSP20 family protein
MFWSLFEELWELDRMLSSVFDRVPMLLEPGFEMRETPDQIVVQVELPGFRNEDIDISVKENYLVIQAERKEEKSEDENVIVNRRFYGVIRRVIPIPVKVQTEGIEAYYDKGILEIRLPKQEKKEVKIVVKDKKDDNE